MHTTVRHLRRELLRPITLVLLVLLIAVTAGTAWAALARNSVGSLQLKNGQVKAADLGTNSVTSVKVAPRTLVGSDVRDGTLTAADLGAGAVTAAKLAVNSVGGTAIAAGSIDASHIVAGAVGSAQIADGSITRADLADGTSPVRFYDYIGIPTGTTIDLPAPSGLTAVAKCSGANGGLISEVLITRAPGFGSTPTFTVWSSRQVLGNDAVDNNAATNVITSTIRATSADRPLYTRLTAFPTVPRGPDAMIYDFTVDIHDEAADTCSMIGTITG